MLFATSKPPPTYPKDKKPCDRCGLLVTAPNGERKKASTGLCRDCRSTTRNGKDYRRTP